MASVLSATVLLGGFQGNGGGSNLAWYYRGSWNGCDQTKYGVIHNYPNDAGSVNVVVDWLYNNGQRRLRLPVFFYQHGDQGVNPAGGDSMGSMGGQLSTYYATGLQNLVTYIKNKGFWEIVVSMHPLAGAGDCNDPRMWDYWAGMPFTHCLGLSQAQRDDWRAENLGVILQVKSILDTVGMPYRIDLGNELVPTTSQPNLLDYTQKLWQEYMIATGNNKASTVGFSVIATMDRVPQIPSVYLGNPPDIMQLHFYSSNGNTFQSVHNWFQSNPTYNKDWVIGEADFNSQSWAQYLDNAIAVNPRTVWFTLQWEPVPQLCSGFLYKDFTEYLQEGF